MWIAPLSASRMLRRSVGALVVLASILLGSYPAFAFRPFDGTDAAVADAGEVEIELQPVGRIRQSSDKTLIAPATVFNFGLSSENHAPPPAAAV